MVDGVDIRVVVMELFVGNFSTELGRYANWRAFRRIQGVE